MGTFEKLMNAQLMCIHVYTSPCISKKGLLPHNIWKYRSKGGMKPLHNKIERWGSRFHIPEENADDAYYIPGDLVSKRGFAVGYVFLPVVHSQAKIR